MNDVFSHGATSPAPPGTGTGCKAYDKRSCQGEHDNYFFHNCFLG